MRRPTPICPPVPPGLNEQERAAFVVWDRLNAECSAAGWTLRLRVNGFGAGRFATMDLRRGTGRHSRLCATWHVSRGVWCFPGAAPEACATVERATELIRGAVAAKIVDQMHERAARRKPKPRPGREVVEPEVHTTHFGGPSLAYLCRDKFDGDSDE